MNRKAGIMATLSDVRCTEDFVSRLHKAGADSIRINSAHTEKETFERMVETIRKVDPSIKILMDTKGPEIRTTATQGEQDIALPEGKTIELTFRQPTDKNTIGLAIDETDLNLKRGDHILIDDGNIELIISNIDNRRLQATVSRGGMLGSRKTVSIPNHDLSFLPAVSDKDRRNIRLAIDLGIDMIAHSFVRSSADVAMVRNLLGNSPIRLFSKIECRTGVENMESILDVSDGLLIARGDLGTEIDITRIPIVQYKAAKLCNKNNKPSILATQIMSSMLTNPTPTRAEVSDISNAIREGISTLLLTNETAQGKYPEECIRIMKRTIDNTISFFF